MKAIVTGGGIIGLNIALALQEKGFSVTLIEPERVRTSASYGNAGHIAIEQVEPLASMEMIKSAPRRLYSMGGALALPLRAIGRWLPFSLRMLKAARPQNFARGKAALASLMKDAMRAWQKRLTDIGAAGLLRVEGHYIVWESPETAQKGLAGWKATDTGDARFRPVSDTELAQLSSLTKRRIYGAVRFENTGQITDMPLLISAMETGFVARGGVIHYERVARIAREGDAASVVLAGGEVLCADKIIVAAGVWSKALLEPLGLKAPIIAERGYHIQTSEHGWPKHLPPVVFEDRSMIVTGFDGGLRAASFVELGSPDAPPDPGKWQRLKRHVGELGLPFDGMSLAAQWFGIRPTLPDYLPAIGQVKSLKNLYYAFGHQHLGLTLGAVTGDIVADMVTGSDAPADFSLERFN